MTSEHIEISIDKAKAILIDIFRYEYKAYIKNRLAGDFAVALANKITNQIVNQEYKKYEFCKAIGCSWRVAAMNNGLPDERCIHRGCRHTAKEFHHWLKDNGFKIVKEQASDEP